MCIERVPLRIRSDQIIKKDACWACAMLFDKRRKIGRHVFQCSFSCGKELRFGVILTQKEVTSPLFQESMIRRGKIKERGYDCHRNTPGIIAQQVASLHLANINQKRVTYLLSMDAQPFNGPRHKRFTD